MDARRIGLAVVELGGGRSHADDAIDASVGLTDVIALGTAVQPGSPLCQVHAASDADADAAIAAIRRAILIEDAKPSGDAGRPGTDRAMNAPDLAAYARDGFLVVPDSCRRPIATPCRRARPSWWRASIRGRCAPFSPRRTRAHAKTRYFRESGGAIRFFFEEEAIDQPTGLALNKIGHALHDLDPVFDRISRQPRLAALARDVGLAQPLLLQSMYLFKQPRIGGEVGWHQDAPTCIRRRRR